MEPSLVSSVLGLKPLAYPRRRSLRSYGSASIARDRSIFIASFSMILTASAICERPDSQSSCTTVSTTLESGWWATSVSFPENSSFQKGKQIWPAKTRSPVSVLASATGRWTTRPSAPARTETEQNHRTGRTLLMSASVRNRIYRKNVTPTYFDAEHRRFLVFLTNNFELPAWTIASLYKSRWQVELFFKWVKQHLRIKAFFGTSQNAVRTQIWIAISIYLLVAIVKKELNLSASLYQILQVVSVTIFERVPILQALQLQNNGEKSGLFSNQLSLFDL